MSTTNYVPSWQQAMNFGQGNQPGNLLGGTSVGNDPNGYATLGSYGAIDPTGFAAPKGVDTSMLGNFLPNVNATSAVPGLSNLWGALGTKETPGWGGAAIGALSGFGNAILGSQQLGLAKDSFTENKKQFAANYENQRTLTNSRLADRQAARVASAGAGNNTYQSVGDYMKKNEVKSYG